MATLTVQSIVRTGLTPAYAAAAAGGDVFPNDGETYFGIVNGGGSPVTVTFESEANPSVGEAEEDLAVAVGAGVTKFIGPFPQRAYNNADGRVAVTYSGVTTVTVGAFSLAE